MLTFREINRLELTGNSLSNVHKDLPRPDFREKLNLSESGEEPAASIAPASRLVHVGNISKGAPTVSHLLIRHSEYGKSGKS